MSELYERVTKAVKAAYEQQGLARQYLVMHPCTWAELKAEFAQDSDEPRRWGATTLPPAVVPGLMGFDIRLDADVHPDLVLLRSERHF